VQLLWPLNYALRKLYGLENITNETIRVINGLLEHPNYNANDYSIRFNFFGQFSVAHRKTGVVLASGQTKYCYVEYQNLHAQSKLFPTAFANVNAKVLECKETLHFWFGDGKVSSVVANINTKQVNVAKYYGIGAEHPFHNTIKIIMDGQLCISKINKEVWDASEMYGYTIEDKEYLPSTPLNEIFSISNMFINDKASLETK
jgi:hypothetical protein